MIKWIAMAVTSMPRWQQQGMDVKRKIWYQIYQQLFVVHSNCIFVLTNTFNAHKKKERRTCVMFRPAVLNRPGNILQLVIYSETHGVVLKSIFSYLNHMQRKQQKKPWKLWFQEICGPAVSLQYVLAGQWEHTPPLYGTQRRREQRQVSACPLTTCVSLTSSCIQKVWTCLPGSSMVLAVLGLTSSGSPKREREWK